VADRNRSLGGDSRMGRPGLGGHPVFGKVLVWARAGAGSRSALGSAVRRPSRAQNGEMVPAPPRSGPVARLPGALPARAGAASGSQGSGPGFGRDRGLPHRFSPGVAIQEAAMALMAQAALSSPSDDSLAAAPWVQPRWRSSLDLALLKRP